MEAQPWSRTRSRFASVVRDVVDDGGLVELKETSSKNLLIGFARLHSHALGIVASRPASLAGTLDIDSSVKGARCVRLCDAFNIPLLVLVDTPASGPAKEVSRDHPARCQARLSVRGSNST